MSDLADYPTHLGWGWVTPDEQIQDIHTALNRAFAAEGVPPSLRSHLVNRATEIFEKWDYTQHKWRAYYDSLTDETDGEEEV